MTGSTRRRDQQVGTFFVTHAGRLQRAVRRHLNHVGDALIEDACQMAWTRLLQRPDITLDARGFGWLTTVAVHEAWRLGPVTQEQPAGALTSPADCNRKPGERPEPADTDHRGTAERALDHIEHDDRLQAMRALKPSEREALYLNGLGYTYREITRLSGATYTAVNRRIREGRAALRRQISDDHGPRH